MVLNLRLGAEAEQNAGIYQMLKGHRQAPPWNWRLKPRGTSRTRTLWAMSLWCAGWPKPYLAQHQWRSGYLTHLW